MGRLYPESRRRAEARRPRILSRAGAFLLPERRNPVTRPQPAALFAVTALLALLPMASSGDEPYSDVVARVASMVSDPEARALASRHGLQLLDLTWEDTGRWLGSSLGPNISDVTIEVKAGEGPGRRLALMPVLRFPNFTDRTADVRLDRIFVRVGNERPGARERVISLRDLLADPGRHLSSPRLGTIRGGTLLTTRDSHALLSAQAAFLPVPRGGKATFHPVIFNYQSTAGNPAVLTILVTRQGTSLTVVDNARDTARGGRSWGQRLFFNAGGQRAALTAERISDVLGRGVTSNGESAAEVGDDANLLLLVQVPLRHRQALRQAEAPLAAVAVPGPAEAKAIAGAASDMEVAVLGHGELEGPYTELAGLEVERDPRFPVRVTVQFYQAVSSPHVTGALVAHLAGLVGKVYEKGDWVGSLVCPEPEAARRPTAWEGTSPAPEVAWWDFPGLLERWRGRAPRPAIGVK
jgi:hypothetical protein